MSTLPLFPEPAPERPTFRLLFPDDDLGGPDDHGLSADVTLSEFIERYVVPVCLVNAKPRNLIQYRESGRYWKRFTADPPLRSIDDFTCAQFVAGLRTLAGQGGQPLAENTIRKHCVHVQYCLDRAGPKVRHNPRAKQARLLPEVPIVDRPRLVVNEVDDNFTLAEIGHWLDACTHAEAPHDQNCQPPDWWRALVLVAYNTGLRIETLIKLRWGWLREDELGHWLQVPPGAIKKSHGRSFYLPPAGLKSLEPIRPAAPRVEAAIFPWPHTESWLHECRRRLLGASKIAPGRRWGFHGLRKAFGTELAKIDGAAVSWALGHSAGSVAQRHYVNHGVYVA
ncbi:MAG TPA: site-specific integrase, partial [Pirellulales bacterium]|nr:site-specific integrase [Pirellulales bacterium]